jgi:NADPH2:quinone reductase
MDRGEEAKYTPLSSCTWSKKWNGIEMKAAFINRTGPAESIVYGDLPTPHPGPSQCLVKVAAVAVNPIDTYLRGGLIPMQLPMPYVLGCDLAGTVVEARPKVTRFKAGDRVWGTNQGLLGRQGTFGEFAAVDEDWLYPIPNGVSDEQAAALSLVSITAHLGLVRDAKLKSGEILFVNGGSGGVGSAVVQMAKALGARVISTAGTDEKAARVRKLGADLAINYKSENVEAAIKAFAPDGVNVWWETLREPDFDRAIAHLAPRGRMIVMAGREARPPFPVGPFYVKGCSLHGFAMFNATPGEQRAAAEDINRWMVEGKLKANIDRVLPLAQAALAHRLQEENTIGKAGTLAGKIVLKV